MHNQAMNRRQFMRAGAGSAALGFSTETKGLGTNGGLGSNADHESRVGDVPVLTEDYQVIQRDSNNKGACLIRIPSDQRESLPLPACRIILRRTSTRPNIRGSRTHGSNR